MTRRRTGRWLVLLAILGLAYAAFGHWLTTEHGKAVLGGYAPYLPWLYFAQHVVFFLALAAWFGSSLQPGRTPLVTRFATLVEGTLSPAGLTYTRRVTIAWAAFFASLVATSALLFGLGPLPVWSLFANLLTLPLVGAMFVAEYLVRLRACPELAHGSIARGVMISVRAYWDSAVGPSAGPR